MMSCDIRTGCLPNLKRNTSASPVKNIATFIMAEMCRRYCGATRIVTLESWANASMCESRRTDEPNGLDPYRLDIEKTRRVVDENIYTNESRHLKVGKRWRAASHWQRGTVTNFFLPRATHRGLIIADMRWRPSPPPPELCLTLKMVDIAQPPKVQRRRRRLASSSHILPRRSHPPMFVADSSSPRLCRSKTLNKNPVPLQYSSILDVRSLSSHLVIIVCYSLDYYCHISSKLFIRLQGKTNLNLVSIVFLSTPFFLFKIQNANDVG